MRHLMLAHWYSQDIDRYDDSLSVKLALRLVNKSDKHDTDETTRACSDLGLYVFYCRKTLMIELKAFGIHSASQSQLKERLDLLTKLNKKGAKNFDFGSFYREADVFETLTLAVSALGITESVCYHGVGEPETFQPVGLQIKKLADKFC